jgi:hypothetical protein
LEIDQNATDLVELEDNQYCVYFYTEKKIKFLNMNLKKITNVLNANIYSNIYLSLSKIQMILMNKNDLLLAGNENILVIDVQNKIIAKNIQHIINGSIYTMYKLNDKRILLGGLGNYIEQIEYDEIKKNIKVISNNGKKDKIVTENFASPGIFSVSVFKNNLIVSPFNNKSDHTSLIIYQLKNI